MLVLIEYGKFHFMKLENIIYVSLRGQLTLNLINFLFTQTG